METLRRRPTEEPRPSPPEPPPLHATPPPSPEIPAPPTVRVQWGPAIENIALDGMTVGAARELLRRTMNIAPYAATLVNGRRVTAQHRLAAGETLEFVREGGEKGAGA